MKPKSSILDPALIRPAILDAFKKLDPRVQFKNPVMFVVEVVSVLTTGLWIQALFGHGEAPATMVVALTATAALTILMFFFAELPLALARQLAGG